MGRRGPGRESWLSPLLPHLQLSDHSCVYVCPGQETQYKKKNPVEMAVRFTAWGSKDALSSFQKSSSQIQTRSCWWEAPAGPLAPVSLLSPWDLLHVLLPRLGARGPHYSWVPRSMGLSRA